MDIRATVFLIAASVAFQASPTPLRAQEPQERRDSLELEVRALRASLDSLRQVLARLVRQGQDTTEVADELAALRAAARAAAPEQPADTSVDQSVIRSRSLNRLNPEISVTADVRFNANRPGPQRDNVDVRVISLSLQSDLDPYAYTKIFIGFSGQRVGIGEAYAYWTGGPGGLRVGVGRFRQRAGELNRWHLHALPESEWPLVITEYFGNVGLVGDGLNLYWITPFTTIGGGVHELWGQLTVGRNDRLFDQGNRPAILGHLNNFWQISRPTFFQFGLTGVYGENPDSGIETTVLGADLRLTWSPLERIMYRSFTVRSEVFAVRQKVFGSGDLRWGGYVGVDYQTSRQLHIGGRVDYVEPLGALETQIWQSVLRATWWQSPWVYLRAEWQHLSRQVPSGGWDNSDRFVLQVVWSIGPHKHERY